MSENNKPLRTTQAGQIKLTVWENENNEIKSISFTPKKSYTKDEGKTWQETDTYYKGDLVNLRTLIDNELNKNIKQL